MLEGVFGMVVKSKERDERRGWNVDRDGRWVVEEVEEIVRRAPPALLVLVPVLGVLVVEGDDVVFLGEGPPPLEALPGGETEL